MLSTDLTRSLGLEVPIIGAPMSPMCGGRLAAALSNCGALGMIGVSSNQPIEQLDRDVAEYRSLAADRHFGIGLMVWAVDRRPELLDAVLRAKPFAVALSFGDPSKYVQRLREAGVRVFSQVQDRVSALRAESAGVDLVVAQGTDAGGHTGGVGTLPLLQIVLQSVRLPVVAAGGIATGRGLAAALAAGAQGAWIGTPLLVSEEVRNSPRARQALIAAKETETIHTRVFDVVQGIAFPPSFPGRALANDFARRWHGHESELARDEGAQQAFRQAKEAEDYSQAYIYAGQSVGLLERVEPAAQIVRRMVSEAEALLRAAAALVV
ncbi:MAG TPA: nitronate monooxygenase [Polyangiaceae bacterium]|nr:nitronate monooxygenase [Polyangiaceae bacterium]